MYLKRYISVGAFIVFAPFFLNAHPLHLSVTSIEQRKNKLAVKVKVFTTDLKLISYNYKNEKKSLNAYFNSHLIILNANCQTTLYLHSIKDSSDVVYIHFKAALKNENAIIHVENTILFDYFEDQTNLILYTSEKQSEGYKCNHQSKAFDIVP